MNEKKRPGETLRGTRLFKGLSLDEISKKTKINKKYLEALENEVVDIFPGEVYLRGFLRNYASFLGLDPDELISDYEESGLLQRPKVFISSKSEVVTFLKDESSIPVRRRLLGDWFKTKEGRWFTYIGLGSVILCIIIWSLVSGWSVRPKRVAKEEVITTPKAENVIREEPPIPEEPTYLLVEIEGIEESWVQFIKDSGEKGEVILKPGETLKIEAKESVEIKTGNAGGLRVRLNGKELGLLGKRGEVVTKIITSHGISPK